MKTLAIACLLLCSAGLAQAQNLTVSAAASLTDAFNDVKMAYEQINPEVTLYMNYASSGALYRQITHGAPADVYASANPKWMNQAEAKGFIVQGTKRTFAHNALVLINPAGNPAGIDSVNELQSDRVSRIGIGTPETVPAGQYTKVALQGLTIYESLASKYIFGEDVRQVLDYSRRGEGFTLQSRMATSASRLVLFGPSGSGKTLTLRAIAGLTQPSRGHIRINGQTLYDSGRGVNLPTRKRKVSLIFQDYALFPHMSVRQNIAFGARRLWRPRSKAIEERIEQLIATCELCNVAEAVPEEISGGQRQRTALARGLAAEPELVLMDEPFSALDKPLRTKMQRDVITMLDHINLQGLLLNHQGCPKSSSILALRRREHA